jgi:hypothetical protein
MIAGEEKAWLYRMARLTVVMDEFETRPNSPQRRQWMSLSGLISEISSLPTIDLQFVKSPTVFALLPLLPETPNSAHHQMTALKRELRRFPAIISGIQADFGTVSAIP